MSRVSRSRVGLGSMRIKSRAAKGRLEVEESHDVAPNQLLQLKTMPRIAVTVGSPGDESIFRKCRYRSKNTRGQACFPKRFKLRCIRTQAPKAAVDAANQESLANPDCVADRHVRLLPYHISIVFSDTLVSAASLIFPTIAAKDLAIHGHRRSVLAAYLKCLANDLCGRLARSNRE